MRKIEITLYKFEELSKEAQEKAIEELHDINTNYEWWQSTYEDAANILLKITGFDLDRNEINVRSVHGHTIECIANMILKNHGKECNTYHLAENLPNMCYNDFFEALRMEYLKMLKQDYDYRTSISAISETIIANEYDFTESGKFFYEKLIQ